MTTLGIQIGWLAARVTLVALLASCLALWTGRRAARSNVMVLAGAMLLFVGLTAAAFCPLPDFYRWSNLAAPAAVRQNAEADADADAKAAVERGPNAGFTLDAVRAWLAALSHRPESPAWRSCWDATAWIYGAGVALGFMRLLLGSLGVRSLRRRSRPVTDYGMLRLADELRLALGCPRPITLRECREPGLAATVGWRRALIFLPPEWPSWNTDERRAVLAHELAHVRHADYLIGFLARCSQALHFYHPFVRRLSALLRWQQEVAADSLAARIAGGREIYLKALARLALRSPVRTPVGAMAWSALTGPTLLRRLHMLHGTERRPLGWTMRGLIIGLLAGTALMAASLGNPLPLPAAEERQAEVEPYELGYLGPDTMGFCAARPAVWFQQPGMTKAVALVDQGLQLLKMAGVVWPEDLRPENIEQIVTDLRISSDGTGKQGSRQVMFGASAVYVRMNRDVDWAKALTSLFKQYGKQTGANDSQKGEEVDRDGVKLYRLGCMPILGPGPVSMYLPDRRSVVLFLRDKVDLRKLIRNAPSARTRDWGEGVKRAAATPLVMAFDNQSHYYTKLHAADLKPKDLKILKKIRFAALAVELGEGRPVRLMVDTSSAAAARSVEKAFDGYARLIQDEIRDGEKSGVVPASHSKDKKRDGDLEERLQLQLTTELLQSRRVHRDGSHLEFTGFSSVRLSDFVENEFSPSKKK